MCDFIHYNIFRLKTQHILMFCILIRYFQEYETRNLSANNSLLAFAKAHIFAIIKSVPIRLPKVLPKLDF